MVKTINKANREILITRYLSQEACPEEIVELQKWLGASRDNLLYFQEMKNIWDNSELNAIEKSINEYKAFNKISQRVTLVSPMTNFWYYWKKFAAVLLIPLVLGNLLYLQIELF